jgi:toxin ParE1/3/4
VRLLWSFQARQDLVGIGHFIALDDRPAARRWVARLQERARSAAEFPLAGRIVPEIGRDDVREVLAGNYRLVYRGRQDHILVLAVQEGHRHLPEDLTATEPG